MITVLVSAAFDSEHLGLLRDEVPDVTFVQVSPDGKVPRQGMDGSVLFWCDDTNKALVQTLRDVPDIKWIHSCTAGVDQLWHPMIEQRRVTVTRSALTSHIPVSEWVMACILAKAKQLPELKRAQEIHQWASPRPAELYGSTLGIVGAGVIGTEVARRAAAFGMRTLGSRRSDEPSPYFDETLDPSRLPSLLEESDFVVVSTALTEATRGLMGRNEFQRMKPTSILVNVARGAVIDEGALVAAIISGEIAGACLDVFAEEPLPPGNPLWRLPQVLISPHTAWKSPNTRIRGVFEFAANLQLFLQGKPLQNLVGSGG